ncbi:MAG: tetratricopeptide repeat protein [Leptospiraceae bacterium]|nr:tetratricopeptide repeat protein [Leptospiraceae bacterium]MCB1315591.1 tetratricopeptide repeat protein [Leptospiraceae bacterium]
MHSDLNMRAWFNYCVLFAGLIVVAAALSAQSEARDKPRALVLLSADTNIYAEALNGMQSVLNFDIEVLYLDNIREEYDTLADLIEERDAQAPTLIISLGPQATDHARRNVKDIPVLFSMLDNPRTLGLNSLADTCGIAIEISTVEFFQTLKEINPEARFVYAPFSTDDGEIRATEGEYHDLRQGLIYRKLRVRDTDDLEDSLEEIKPHVDAIYMITDALYDREVFEMVSRFSRENGVVLMTGFAPLVKAGATFAITPDYNHVGILTGRMVNRILSGESTCAQEYIQYPEYTSFYLNDEYAREAGIQIPESISQRANNSRLFRAGVDLYRQGKYETALKVFDVIVKKDPGNSNAAGYHALILEKITGNQTTQYMNRARQYMRAGNYAAASQQYQAALRLNPGHPDALRGYRDARRSLSEQERQTAARLRAGGQPFAAIRRYQAAIQALPENQAAQAELNALRQSILPQIPGLIETGIDAYNGREYDRAIEIFENILLVQPGNGEANEYLRLSRRKKAALDQILNSR